MKTSPTWTVAAKALVAAQAVLDNSVTKASKGDKGKYASLTLIVETVRPVLLSHGFVIIQGVRDGDVANVIDIETTLLHESGEWISSMVRLPLVGARRSRADIEKDGIAYIPADAQAGGGTITYGRRYGLAAMLCLINDEDDDGAKAAVNDVRRELTIGQSGATLDPSLMPLGGETQRGKPIADMPLAVLRSALAHARANNMVAEARIISGELTKRSLAGKSAERALASAEPAPAPANGNGNHKHAAVSR